MLETTDDFSPAENEDPEFQFVGFKKGKRIYRRVRPASSVLETAVIRQPLVSAVGEEVPRGDYWRTLEYSGLSPSILQSVSANVVKEGVKPIATEEMCKPSGPLTLTTVPGFEIQNTFEDELKFYGLSDEFIQISKKYSNVWRQAKDSKQSWPTGSTGDLLDWKQRFAKSLAPKDQDFTTVGSCGERRREDLPNILAFSGGCPHDLLFNFQADHAPAGTIPA